MLPSANQQLTASVSQVGVHYNQDGTYSLTYKLPSEGQWVLHPTVESVAIKQNDLLVQAEQGPLQARDISFTLQQLTGDVAMCGSRCRVQIQVQSAASLGGAHAQLAETTSGITCGSSYLCQLCRSVLKLPGSTSKVAMVFWVQQLSLLHSQPQTLPTVSQHTFLAFLATCRLVSPLDVVVDVPYIAADMVTAGNCAGTWQKTDWAGGSDSAHIP